MNDPASNTVAIAACANQMFSQWMARVGESERHLLKTAQQRAETLSAEKGRLEGQLAAVSSIAAHVELLQQQIVSQAEIIGELRGKLAANERQRVEAKAKEATRRWLWPWVSG